MSLADASMLARQLFERWKERSEVEEHYGMPGDWCRSAGDLLELLVATVRICEACGSQIHVRERYGMAEDSRGTAWICDRCIVGDAAEARCRQLMRERAAVVKAALEGWRG